MKKNSPDREVVPAYVRNLAEKINFLHEELLLSKQESGISDCLLPIRYTKGSTQQAILAFRGLDFFKGYRSINRQKPANLKLNIFQRSAATLACSLYEITDFNNAWYEMGLMGLTRNIDETAEFLKKRVAADGCEPYASMGFSAGAYASVILGTLIGVKVVVAFGVQAILNENIVKGFSDGNPYTPSKIRAPDYKFAYPSLVDFVSNSPQLPKIVLVVAADHKWDVIAAERIAAARPDAIQVHKVKDCDSHNVIAHMMKRGMFEPFLVSALRN